MPPLLHRLLSQRDFHAAARHLRRISRFQLSRPLRSSVIDPSWAITYGDYMFSLPRIYSGYYLFEVCFWPKFASAINVIYYICLLIFVQTALALYGDLR